MFAIQDTDTSGFGGRYLELIELQILVSFDVVDLGFLETRYDPKNDGPSVDISFLATSI